MRLNFEIISQDFVTSLNSEIVNLYPNVKVKNLTKPNFLT